MAVSLSLSATALFAAALLFNLITRDDRDERAADDVLAEQHALRAADDLDPLEVEEVVVEVAGATHVDAVDEGADRGIRRWRIETGIGDTADVELDVERRVGGQREAGHGGGEVAGRVLDPAILGTTWLSADELRAAGPARRRSPLVLRCVEDYLAGRRYPLEMLAHVIE